MNVAETETEDQAVKRYMRAVVQSGVINKVRAELSEVFLQPPGTSIRAEGFWQLGDSSDAAGLADKGQLASAIKQRSSSAAAGCYQFAQQRSAEPAAVLLGVQ